MRLDLVSFCVRDLTASDSASLARYANNRQIWLNLRDRFPHPYSQADADAFIAHVAQQPQPTVWAIEVAGEAAGTIGITLGGDVERTGAEIGYWLGEPYWGRGIMTQAVTAVTAWSLNQFQLTRIYALPFATSAASCRVLEKAGYTCEGRLRKSAIKDGQILDQFMYAYVTPDRATGAIWRQ
ncbi:MAG: GNAT family N-acetyltransferase [Planctomycetaceae bacterium]|nr:GNAT family N-acetyltransferase [Planctomycetaceae bacterium]